MSKCYLWDEVRRKVIVTERLYQEEAAKQWYLNMFCVDDVHSSPEPRYGKFNDKEWVHIRLCHFPAEFRTWLLIMGVP
jgi:hypothetical protein